MDCWKLAGLLLLASPLFAEGPIYKHGGKLDLELQNVYNDIRNAKVTMLTASSGTVKSFMVTGTETNDNAPTGRIGEYIASVAGATNLPTSNNWGDLTSISLTPGDWDITFVSESDKSTATEAQFTNIQIGISQTSGNSATGLVDGDNLTQTRFANGMTTISMTISSYRQSIASTTIIYAKMRATYAGGQPVMYGRLSARRIR